jgi:hypothetical protein
MLSLQPPLKEHSTPDFVPESMVLPALPEGSVTPLNKAARMYNESLKKAVEATEEHSVIQEGKEEVETTDGRLDGHDVGDETREELNTKENVEKATTCEDEEEVLKDEATEITETKEENSADETKPLEEPDANVTEIKDETSKDEEKSTEGEIATALEPMADALEEEKQAQETKEATTPMADSPKEEKSNQGETDEVETPVADTLEEEKQTQETKETTTLTVDAPEEEKQIQLESKESTTPMVDAPKEENSIQEEATEVIELKVIASENEKMLNENDIIEATEPTEEEKVDQPTNKLLIPFPMKLVRSFQRKPRDVDPHSLSRSKSIGDEPLEKTADLPNGEPKKQEKSKGSGIPLVRRLSFRGRKTSKEQPTTTETNKTSEDTPGKPPLRASLPPKPPRPSKSLPKKYVFLLPHQNETRNTNSPHTHFVSFV